MLKPFISEGPVFNVGVLGCGEVAQVAHIPNLQLANHMYNVVAVCDISLEAAQHCGEKFHVKEVYTDYKELLASPTKIDLVFVLTNDAFHCTHITAALRAGKHVFIEKPMAQTLAECDKIAKVSKETGKIVFVGYMRRYAPALLELKEILKGHENDIKYVRVRDIIGNNMYFTQNSGMYQRYFTPPNDPSIAEALVRNFKENLPELEPSKYNIASLSLLGSLASHDLSAMRDLIGMPKRILAAARAPDDGSPRPVWWTVLFDYGTFRAFYEMSIDAVPIFDAQIEVHTGDKRIKVQYDTPYVKGLPITLTTLSSPKGLGDLDTSVYRPTHEDTYTIELRVLYDALTKGTPFKTTPEDAKQDVELNLAIMRALKE
ncbi:hypothetical protein TREMEDRAFT_26442 [Tremella mesenterica DSM 1558]|uniref:uncharacterized protein n=1 Tax=Tremella mesenterica (strain ATCC 24925 / CBS 8224 / DSM 1558 / NBRC 9311 / NRRL Y-6157 / RJB 2259-6 / UBC 559-6) TaxID=578456 RepID=UPI0003F4A3CB|nr:uncharacterized protein TREMEDRAFT_26442 [Tremella mesenterica DSM 1558]EIW72159.1 hypothetical protein TREMEDRAFT_26442 [Tremella mesenterica DSM 1558]